ncbi:unannotated protein [freshwater metagenome]|uniref:Unannotated protein n=1 Tax=freshwater metagenome TaxID=449393 RepID=A0A6J6NTQ0_9ZZZZ
MLVVDGWARMSASSEQEETEMEAIWTLVTASFVLVVLGSVAFGVVRMFGFGPHRH